MKIQKSGLYDIDKYVHRLIVIIIGNGVSDTSSKAKVICVSHHTNALIKIMNPSVFLSVKSK